MNHSHRLIARTGFYTCLGKSEYTSMKKAHYEPEGLNRVLRKQQHPNAFVTCYLPFLASEMERLGIICVNFTEIASDCELV